MKNKKKIFFSFLVVIIFFLAGFFLVRNLGKSSIVQVPENIKYVEIAGQSVKVDLALTSTEQTQGLSGRENLPPNTGMLFVFAKPDKYLFWMKDMNFPIDMIWFNADLKVIFLKKDATPGSYPETYGPGVNDGQAKYVLEVPAGFSEQNHLQIGDEVKFSS
jgi:uncharacterized membrane protein (UPF0127 family)